LQPILTFLSDTALNRQFPFDFRISEPQLPAGDGGGLFNDDVLAGLGRGKGIVALGWEWNAEACAVE
jgi:hypothetical protein